VVGALEPKFESIHGRLTDQVRETAQLKGVVSLMPTKDDMHNIVDQKLDRISKRRQWLIGALIAIPAAIMALVAIIKLFA
jgi:hypothetical protein